MLDLERILLFDGAMGTMLQRRGLKLGAVPETLNISAPDEISAIHNEYLDAGADVVLSNTFGANRFKAEKLGVPLCDLVRAGVRLAKGAAAARGKYAALDIGPCGKVLAPSGNLDFEEAVEVFAEIVRAGEDEGADLILLETFTDLYEIKAAVLAAKENSKLPIFATMSFEENGTTFFGCCVESMVATLEGLGVSALGVNCSLGPKQLAPIVDRILASSHIPVLVQPNAGLPVIRDGHTAYDITAEEFAGYARRFVESGVRFIGGCCGTTPEYIRLVRDTIEGLSPIPPHAPRRTIICSPAKTVCFDDGITVIGERLNPTGKKTLQAALRSGDTDYLLREALRQQEQGAQVLDLNAGLPDIDEAATLAKATQQIQAVSPLPLQLDSSLPAALERAARLYNGKPLLNSVNGKKESLDAVLPIAKKYGCAVLGLALDEDGIPETAEGRLAVARKIVAAAEATGIPREDVLIDCLVMTASAQQDQAMETLKALALVKKELGVRTVLGVSNVSFGLPQRPVVNRTMLAMAFSAGLDAPIMNPGDAGMAETVAAARVLLCEDKEAAAYIARFSSAPEQKPESKENIADISYAIIHGLEDESAKAVKELLVHTPPMTVVEEKIIPALDIVGKDYETGEIFLPQLIKSAEAAQAAFEIIRSALAHDGSAQKGEKFVIATVYGDIHDIGKNIVRTILENYNFDVIDLGRDVPPERVAEAVKESGAKIVGLSALMTTTVASMKDTIALLRQECPEAKVIVGGAVLTPQLAEYAGADYYAKDAMETVRIAEMLSGGKS